MHQARANASWRYRIDVSIPLQEAFVTPSNCLELGDIGNPWKHFSQATRVAAVVVKVNNALPLLRALRCA